MLIGAAVLAAGATLLTLTGLYFHPLLALWLLALGLLMQFRADVASCLLFLSLPFDLVRPLPFSLYVSFSEIQIFFCIAALVWNRGLGGLDWRPVYWWAPFLGAIAISSTVNLEWYKIAPHCLRNAELALVAWLALNTTLKKGCHTLHLATLIGASLMHFGIGATEIGPLSGGRMKRAASFFANANQYGAYLASISSFLLFRPGKAGHWLLFWIRFAFGAALLGIVFSGSRSSLAAAFAAGLTAAALALTALRRNSGTQLRGWPFLNNDWRWLATALAALLILLGGLAVQPKFREGLLNFGERVNRDLESDFKKRLAVAQVGWQIWEKNPWVGIGPGRWEDVIAKERQEDPTRLPDGLLVHPHNLTLQLAAIFGLLGLSAFVYATARWASAFWSQRQSAWALGALCFGVALTIQNLLDSTYPSLALESGWLAGTALGLAEAEGKGRIS